MSGKREARSNALRILAEPLRERFEAGDTLALFEFAALHQSHGGEPEDVPPWVAMALTRIAGRYMIGKGRARRGEARRAPTFDSVAGLDRKKKWDSREAAWVAPQMAAVYQSAASMAQRAVRAVGRAMDENGAPVVGNDFGGGCPILDGRLRPTREFQTELGRRFGINANSDEALYRTVQRHLKSSGIGYK